MRCQEWMSAGRARSSATQPTEHHHNYAPRRKHSPIIMAPSYSSQHKKHLTAIVAAAPRKAPKSSSAFFEKFFGHATLHNLDSISPERAASIALAAEKFYATRSKPGPKLSVSQRSFHDGARDVTRTQILALNDDMPFLVDSLSGLFTSLGLTIHLIFHPILSTARDRKGAHSANGTVSKPESLIYAELSPLPAGLTPKQLEQKILHVLTHVKASVDDWATMRERTQTIAEKFTGMLHGASPEEVSETRDLLLWLASNHFVFLGMADFVQRGQKLALDKTTALGIYRLPPDSAEEGIEDYSRPITRDLIAVTKASAISLVHRHAPMDLIVVRRLDARGNFLGELRILGLFTSTVYYRETQHIPFLRRKTAAIMERSGFSKSGHSGKALKTVLEFLPRDELFQIDEERLFATAMGVVSLESKPRVKLFVRPDAFDRFISAMVYIPRERFTTDLRNEIMGMLERAYAGRSTTFYTQLTDSPLARLHVIIATTPGKVPAVEEATLESQIAARANIWADALRDAVVATAGEDSGHQLAAQFADAFPAAYINTHSGTSAAHDIRRVIECIEGEGLALEIFRADDAPRDILNLNCFTRNTSAELSATIPSLEHMGATVIDATPYLLTPTAPMVPVLLRNFTLRVPSAASISLREHKARIEEAIGRIWRGECDDDHLNALVFSAGLSSREVEIMRALSRYLQQLDYPYSQPFIAAALNTHAGLARALVQLFDARFNPAVKGRDVRVDALKKEIDAGLEQISNLAEDRIIRQIYAVIMAVLRTNAYQRAGATPKSYLSMKLRSTLVPEMKLPVPYAEIFVTGRRMEGIHLRGGTVARGGLRWSDRPEDFRTEVLGLMKTQMVKNSVIVPVGSKGGFILRQPPTEREAFMAEGIECYKTFLRGLLDLTDNIVGNKVVPPRDVVRYDQDDPYLVVAADKGTASFSDIANSISAEYGFWLGDAFASGGSVGYDHKAMGITARGGWVSVMRHFHEMGRDIGPAVIDYNNTKKIARIPEREFTATGIGDMSGDVFGNGALLSHHMKLVAAFNHKHIFIDPTPDAAKSYAERARLFALPRSGWNDYNAKLISKGGGVFERAAKSITLTPEMRAVLGTDAQKVTPDELIKIILRAPVDLLWNGGIGTYVKSASESNESVGDRANNAVRINGGELRASIIGEGGNLGFTQRGRIEYARKGGRINTDAIDNSGGVDCSDHEVNIKIAFGSALAAKRLTRKDRDALLKKMTGEVAALVLRDNRLQTQAISIAQWQGTALLEPASQLMTELEGKGFLNREVEALPDAKQLAELRSTKQGLSRPEIAVLLAYAKMDLFNQLKDATALNDAYYEADLLRYFPTAMQKNFAGDIKSHRLRREIVATMVTNSIVNRAGFAFAQSLMAATGLPAADIANAYIATRDAFGLRAFWEEIEATSGVVSAEVQCELFVTLNRFIEHQCRWFLSHTGSNLREVIATYGPGIREIEASAESLLSESLRAMLAADIDELVKKSVPPTLARRMAMLHVMRAGCDIIDIARARKLPVKTAGRIFFELGATLSLGWLRSSAERLAADNYWQQQAVKALVVEFYEAQRRLVTSAIGRFGKNGGDSAKKWISANADAVTRHQRFIAELRAQVALDYPMLVVALRQVQAVTNV